MTKREQEDKIQPYTWNHIDKLSGREKLTVSEKESLCDKISSNTKKPSLNITIATKIIPFPAGALFFAGLGKLNENAIYGLIILVPTFLYLVSALFLYLVKQVWVYDRWKETKKEVMKKDVYRVPIEVGSAWQSEDKLQNCFIQIKYSEDENFCDVFQIPEKTYENIEQVKLFCYYYEGKRDKYRGKYKVFFIDEGNGEEKNSPS